MAALLLSFIDSLFRHQSKQFFEIKTITDRSLNLVTAPIAYSILLLLLAPNVALTKIPTLGYATPTWSIGVEEQFYLLWPWLMKSRFYFQWIVAVILFVYLLSHHLLGTAADALDKRNLLPLASKAFSWADKFFTFWASFRVDAMAIGAVGACLIYKNTSVIIELIFSKFFQVILYAVLFLLLLFPNLVEYQFYSFVFMLVIANLAFNNNTIISLENKTLNYLGQISYGIYLLHSFTIVPAIKLVTGVLHLKINFPSEILICLLSLAGTVTIAALSYRFFEGYFLKLKNRLDFQKNFAPIKL